MESINNISLAVTTLRKHQQYQFGSDNNKKASIISVWQLQH